ncbi:MAG TPA: exodeoxyribonuclease V subunit alpha [Acidimicrobiales bacterium]
MERGLAPWIDAGIVGRFEVQLVAAVARAAPHQPSDACLLALALAARATRLGHVCLDLDAVYAQVIAAQDDDGRAVDMTLPEPSAWRTELADSPIVTRRAPEGAEASSEELLRPLVLEGHRLYLQRFWSFEVEVAAQLAARSSGRASIDRTEDSDAEVDAALEAVFGGITVDDDGFTDLQFVAARRAFTRPVTVLAGGPGTGKTHTVARILASALKLAEDRGQAFRVALAAPTGKAATRMKEAIESHVTELVDQGRLDPGQAAALGAIEPTTIHRLLGRKTRTAFRHDRGDPLLHDLVVIDETSMVSLPLLARLLDAVRLDARLVLVGDPFQLASIEAGTVMADMVGPAGDTEESGAWPLSGRVTELRRGHRFDEGSATAALALAIRDGDADRVLHELAAGHPEVHWVRPDDPSGLGDLRQLVTAAAADVVRAALAGDDATALAAASRVKVLSAIRRGQLGLFEWTDLIHGVAQSVVPAALRGGHPNVGTPVMVTRNDPVNRLANGDVGVVVHAADGRWVTMAGTSSSRRLAPARLGEWEPWWAMTIHKSQGSEFAHAVVSLPTQDSPILTRELLYTAVTRAKPEVTIVGSEEMIRLAIGRPVARASGLRDRLWPDA